ncbi:MAG TPA: hypothetical protein VMV81_12655, partial [Phycisphaerae bacterium]|nr:hypothetical protein [Phycisphaerae bacterium]
MAQRVQAGGAVKAGSRRPRADSPEPNSSPATAALCLAGLALAVLLAFWNSFKGAFVFDDAGAIVAAENIRHLADWRTWMSSERPVIALSLAINYAISGLNPVSYHVFNVGSHILATWTLFGIVRRTLRLPRFGDRVRAKASGIALAVALLWAVHPLQTQALTFVIQRGESMMSLFGLLMFYCVIRGATGGHSIVWYLLSIVAFMLSAGCKVGLPSMPLVLFFYDYLFLTQSVVTTLRRRGLLYLGQLLSFGLILKLTQLSLSLFSSDPGFPVTVGFGLRDHNWWQHAISQPAVVLHYLQLTLWPASLCIDYEWPIPTKAAE